MVNRSSTAKDIAMRILCCLFLIIITVCPSIASAQDATSVSDAHEKAIRFFEDRLDDNTLDNEKVAKVIRQVYMLRDTSGDKAIEDRLTESMSELAASGELVDRELAGIIAAAFYLYQHELQPAYEYSKQTLEPFEFIVTCAQMGIDDPKLSEYVMWCLQYELDKADMAYYLTGKAQARLPVWVLRSLTQFPLSDATKRFLLEYPFARSSAPMVARYRMNLQGATTPQSGENFMDQYYNYVIRDTVLERAFLQCLEHRGMDNSVVKWNGGKRGRESN